jgi:phosphomannomutase
MNDAELLGRVRQWIDNDVDGADQRELEELIAAGVTSDLRDRFAGSLEFGTAGLRGVLGAGPNRMCRAVVIRATYGLLQHLLATTPGAKARGVVVGCDARKGSRQFAEDAAGVLLAAGVAVHLWTEKCPTPLVAFATQHLNCAAGIMITASHNPPEYNGYKAYWGNGAQILAPIDLGIQDAIEHAPAAKDIARSVVDSAGGLLHLLSSDIENAYLDSVKKLSVRSDGDRAFSIVYTPLHGVGNAMARRAFDDAGFTNVVSVPEQAMPDGAFPTVAFPNPEEPGAMDLAFALARARQADLVVANDPDADRLAIAVPSGASPTGYVQLTGNQVGALLGHYLLTGGFARTPATAREGGEPLVIASIVSSPMLGAIARELGARYEEVLTGFKWIANRAIELERSAGAHFIFGFEEALGYAIGDCVRDKDGISAAVLFAELTAVLRAKHETVLGHLEKLYAHYGVFASSQVNVTRKGADGREAIRGMMTRLRGNPPATVGRETVECVRDVLHQTLKTKSGQTSPLSLPKADVLMFDLESGGRIIARPSGTEPKAKFYFDVREPVRPGEGVSEAQARAEASLKSLEASFMSLVAP